MLCNFLMVQDKCIQSATEMLPMTSGSTTPNHCTLHIPSTAPMVCMLFVLMFIVFMYYFTCVSFGPQVCY